MNRNIPMATAIQSPLEAYLSGDCSLWWAVKVLSIPSLIFHMPSSEKPWCHSFQSKKVGLKSTDVPINFQSDTDSQKLENNLSITLLLNPCCFRLSVCCYLQNHSLRTFPHPHHLFMFGVIICCTLPQFTQLKYTLFWSLFVILKNLKYVSFDWCANYGRFSCLFKLNYNFNNITLWAQLNNFHLCNLSVIPQEGVFTGLTQMPDLSGLHGRV